MSGRYFSAADQEKDATNKRGAGRGPSEMRVAGEEAWERGKASLLVEGDGPHLNEGLQEKR